MFNSVADITMRKGLGCVVISTLVLDLGLCGVWEIWECVRDDVFLQYDSVTLPWQINQTWNARGSGLCTLFCNYKLKV